MLRWYDDVRVFDGFMFIIVLFVVLFVLFLSDFGGNEQERGAPSITITPTVIYLRYIVFEEQLYRIPEEVSNYWYENERWVCESSLNENTTIIQFCSNIWIEGEE